ncbi:MAG: hypothetical protein WCK84_10440 [Bacteroidota bacterium]
MTLALPNLSQNNLYSGLDLTQVSPPLPSPNSQASKPAPEVESGQAGASDNIKPVKIDHLTGLKVKQLNCFTTIGQGWFTPSACPVIMSAV